MSRKIVEASYPKKEIQSLGWGEKKTRDSHLTASCTENFFFPFLETSTFQKRKEIQCFRFLKREINPNDMCFQAEINHAPKSNDRNIRYSPHRSQLQLASTRLSLRSASGCQRILIATFLQSLEFFLKFKPRAVIINNIRMVLLAIQNPIQMCKILQKKLNYLLFILL